jgi:hypothetical protein
MQNPDGSLRLACYDETNRPKLGSGLPGQTVRTIFNIPSSASVSCQSNPGSNTAVRELWSRTNALGQLAEVVEPAASGNGSVFDAGSVETGYTYNVLGSLSQILQGPARQQRILHYDSLGRLTAEYLSEKSRTLDDNGNYVGQGGKWSDFFTYDTRSNLTSHVDARGLKTMYDFKGDPLDRLQQLYYECRNVQGVWDTSCETPGTVDSSSPILPSPSASYTYMPTGDVTQLSQVTVQSEGNPPWGFQYGYDSERRLASKTVSYSGQLPLVVAYNHDSLNRTTELVYPKEYGISGNPQKKRVSQP